MKAVLLARGLGSRMKQEDSALSRRRGDAATAEALTPPQIAAAALGAKGMMPIGNPSTGLGTNGRSRPFLDYVLSALADAGCTDVCLVVAPDHAAIRAYYQGPGRPARVTITYAVQEVADGTAHAVLAGQPFAGRDPFLVLNSDNLYPAPVLRSLAGLHEPGLPGYRRDALVRDSGFPAERVNSFAAIEVDAHGYLHRIIEKPGPGYYETAGPETLISMNVWRFDQRIFDACRDVPRSARGEFELPEAVGLAIARGVKFRVVSASGAVLDLSRRSDVALVSERLANQEPRP
jgi:glucose-1-phosphate thymidylyltransferase